MQSIPCGASLVAEMRPITGRGDPLHHPSHALLRRIHFADETHLAHRQQRLRSSAPSRHQSPRKLRYNAPRIVLLR
jgi:hypothetical protein